MDKKIINKGIIQTGGTIGAKNIVIGKNASVSDEDFPSKSETLNSSKIKKPQKTKILFLAANPPDTDRLRLSEEIRTIDRRLRTANFRNEISLIQHWAVRYSDLQEALLRHQPQIVHFSGHGVQSGEVILDNSTGMMKPVSVNALVNLFGVLKDKVRCVVLNACFSKIQAKAMCNHIDVVIGMESTIQDDAAIKFAEGFYLGVGYGRSLATAFNLGCNEIDLAGLKDNNVPKLFSRPEVDPSNIVLLGD